MTPPAITAQRTGRYPLLRRKPVPIWTNDSKITKNENSQKTGAVPQWCDACSEPLSAPHVYSTSPDRHMTTQAAMITTHRG